MEKKMRHRRRNAEELFYLKFAIVVGVGIILGSASQVGLFRSAKDSANEILIDQPACSGNTICRKSNLRMRPRLQFTSKKSSYKSEFVVLMLTSVNNEINIISALDRIINVTRGTGVPVAVSVRREKSENFIRHLYDYPVKVINVPSRPNDDDFIMKFHDSLGTTFQEKIMRGFQVLGKYLSGDIGFKRNTCPAEVTKTSLNVMNVNVNETVTFKYNFPEKDMENQKNMTFGESKYNPNMQKYYKVKYKNVASSPDILKEQKERCDTVHYIKKSLSVLLKVFPGLRYIILVDDQKQFSPDLIRFFRHTSEIFSLDPSIYCVSAQNPLETAASAGPVSELLRVDHFVGGGATLIPSHVAKEIIDHYDESFSDKETKKPIEDYSDPLDNVISWFSFHRRRKLRGCVIPAVSRVCPLTQSCDIPSTSFEMRKLVRYKYSIDILPKVEKVEALSYSQLPCNSDVPLKPKNSSASLAVYVKMDSVDDDITLHRIMQCFGIEHHVPIGNYDNVYTLFFRGQIVYILGVPHSRFGPTIVPGADLLMAELEPFSIESVSKILRYEDYGHMPNITISSIPYQIIDGSEDKEDTTEQPKSNSTAKTE